MQGNIDVMKKDFCDIFSGFRVAADAKKLKNGYFCSDISPKIFSMKKLFLLFVVMSAAFFAQAAPVDSITAKQVATHFFTQNVAATQGGTPTFEVTPLFEFHNFYILNVTNGNGFVIVSADDRALPVLGYSETGHFRSDNMPSNLQGWLQGYEDEISWVIQHAEMADDSTAQLWQKLLQDTYELPRNSRAVTPLLNTAWGQEAPYNVYCPSNCLTGCVATAMAQVMKYWEYPTVGTGSHSYYHNTYGTLSANFSTQYYAWFDMPNTNPPANNTSIAALMYHCGVSVDMAYGPASTGGSGANYTAISNALITYFGYDENVNTYQKDNYTSSVWSNALINELDNGRPILYFGTGSGGGHEFVCDGYSNSNYFHFNWGWSGYSDGYFMLSSLNPDSYDFTTNQAAVIGIQPPADFGGYNLLLYSNPNPSSTNVTTNQNFTLSVDVANHSSRNYNGELHVVAVNINNTNIGYVIGSKNVQIQGGTYSNINFTSLSIPEAGNYEVGILYGDDYYYIPGYNSYVNGVNVTATGSGMDSYENNNTVATASLLGTVNSNSQTYNVNATLHNTADVDYYKIICPPGYQYTVNANLYSSYNSGNYTADADMYCTTNTNSWGSSYASQMPALTLDNGGTVWFKVVPYDGCIGTYYLHITVTRSPHVNIDETEEYGALTLYPNPTDGMCHISCTDGQADLLRLYDLQGRLLVEQPVGGESAELNLSNFPSGLYFVQLYADNRLIAVRKLLRQ